MAVSKRLRYEVLRRDQHRCRYCGAAAPDVKLTIDHVIPSSLGGPDEPANLVTACEPCNSGKTSIPADSPIVANVADDAMRWAAAMEKAAAVAREDYEVRAAYRALFREAWDTWQTKGGGSIPLDPGWTHSLDNFREAGLPDWELAEAVTAAMSVKKLRPENIFRYFCGICWTKIRAMQRQARAILDGPKSEAVISEEEMERRAEVVVNAWKAKRVEAGSPPTEDQEFNISWQAQSWHARGVSIEELVAAAELGAVHGVPYLVNYLGYDQSLIDGVETYFEACHRFHNAAFNAGSMSPGDVLATVEVLAPTFELVSRAFHRFSELAEDIEQRQILSEVSFAAAAPQERTDDLFPDDYPWAWNKFHHAEWPTAMWMRWDPPEAKLAPVPLPDWCGECDGPMLSMRWVSLKETLAGEERTVVARCPRCHPRAVS